MTDLTLGIDAEGTATPGEPESGLEEQPEGSNEPEVFTAEYVSKLREEAAGNRVAAKQAEAYRDALREAVKANVTGSILVDSHDLAWDDTFNDDQGMPNPEAIREAATALADSKPHLARVGGSAGQGYRGEDSDTFSILSFMNSAAG